MTGRIGIMESSWASCSGFVPCCTAGDVGAAVVVMEIVGMTVVVFNDDCGRGCSFLTCLWCLQLSVASFS